MFKIVTAKVKLKKELWEMSEWKSLPEVRLSARRKIAITMYLCLFFLITDRTLLSFMEVE